MKNKCIKIGVIIFIILALFIIVFYIYGAIMTLGNQRLETTSITKEIMQLEKKLKNETKGGSSVYFTPIIKNEYDECHAKLDLRMNINEDSIINDNKGIEGYLNTISNRINDINTKCLDSLIIFVSVKDKRNEKGVLIEKRYSFPIK